MFEAVGARYDGPELEKEILELWRRENVFGRIMTEGAARPQFVFYEGPPTANGRPGIHHVLARTFKDLYPRYKTMRGFHCPRRAGWDTHGLPVEHEIEKELGIFDKKLIEQEVGIAKFTAMCRASVMRHVAEWEAMTPAERDSYVELHRDWFRRHRSQIVGGEELGAPARTKTIKRLRHGHTTTDGPFIETKELLGGFIVVEAESIHAATAMAAEWPALGTVGNAVEVRSTDATA